MKRLCVALALVVGALLVVGGFLVAQDKKTAEPPGRFRGQLPQNWARLGLSEDQKQKTYAIQAKYDKDVEALQAQIRDLKAKEKTELDGVLTAAQKQRLREIVTEKIPGAGEVKKDEDKKP